MTIAKRLMILLAVPLLALLGLGVFTRLELIKVEERSRFVAESRIVALALLGNLSRSFAELRVNVRSYVLATNVGQRTVARAAFDQNEQEVARLLQRYADELVVSNQGRRLLGEYQILSREYITSARRVMLLHDESRRDEAINLLNNQVTELGGRLSKVSAEWIGNNEEMATAAGKEAVTAIQMLRTRMLVADSTAILVTALLGYLTFRKIVKPVRSLEASVKTIAAGDYTKEVPFTEATDETGGLARSIDVLKQGAAAMEEQRWVKASVAKLTSELQAAVTLDDFGQRLLSALVPLLGGGVAGFHLFDEGAAGLRRVAAYGLADAPLAAATIRLGEGLIGQCASERKPVTLSSLPAGYLQITSGLGAAAPTQAAAFPLLSKDTLLGVVEIASFRVFNSREQALLLELLPLASLSLEVLQRNLRTQELLEQVKTAKEKAEEATEMKSMFLANMSHEIRTPMNAIIGLSHLALKTQLTPKQRDYVSKVHNAGTSLLSIINDILDFSKIEAGKLDLETTDFKLDEVITSVTTLTAQKAHDKGLEFLAHVAPGIPEVLLGDPLRLGQVLTNFVNNAVKFTENGEIRLEIEQLERTGEKVQLKFSVRDTGIGMTKEQAAKLFQPFTQADMSTTRKHGGTGLGLTICRRLVELMGGRIWLASEPGLGTTFFFTVWLGVGSAGSGKIIPEKLARLRVLVVDDNPAAREILQEPLSTVVARVDTVESGKEAITAVQRQDVSEPYDIVFMDWRMPGLDGLQTSRHIKGDETLKHQPAIVLVTAFGREEVREEAERLQLDGFLVKPVTKSMIVDTLVNVFADASEVAGIVTEGEQGSRLRGARILLTEDNEINQQIAVELLEGAGATVKVANNGREAVAILSNDPQPPPFDLVLMDLQMPEMDGYQATAALRGDARFANIPIIAMTAHATMEEKQRCLAAGMNDHISKPIDPGNLFETVGRFYKSGPEPLDDTRSTFSKRSQNSDDLPSITGLDAPDGLARVAGNRKLYLKLLRQFVEQQGPAVDQITEALSKGDGALAERLAHTLQGVAGNIGAKSVQSTAATLEKAIRAKSAATEVEAAKRDAAAALNPLIAQLNSLVKSPSPETPAPAAASAPMNPTQSREAAAQLTGLLAEFDAGASDFIESNRAALRPLFDDTTWGEFEKLVQDYSFSDAHTQLEKAIKNFAPV